MTRSDIHLEAQGRWHSLLPAIGIDETFLRNRHGPCPMCKGKDRFRFDNKDGRGTFFCSKCGAGNGIELVMMVKGLSFADTVKLIREKIPGSKVTTVRSKTSDAKATKKYITGIWNAAKPATEFDDVGKYIIGRGLMLPLSKSLRCHPALEYRDNETKKVIGEFPCMLAAIKDKAGEIAGLHRTWLKDGKKAPVDQPKKSLGAYNPGCAIQLYDANGTLGVAEGIETAIAAHDLYKFPCWALISASQLERFEWPHTVKRLLIYGDLDSSFTGQKSCYALAYRAKARGVEVHITFPEQYDCDFADVLVEKRKMQAKG